MLPAVLHTACQDPAVSQRTQQKHPMCCLQTPACVSASPHLELCAQVRSCLQHHVNGGSLSKVRPIQVCKGDAGGHVWMQGKRLASQTAAEWYPAQARRTSGCCWQHSSTAHSLCLRPKCLKMACCSTSKEP